MPYECPHCEHNIEYDYFVNVIVKLIVVSPDNIFERDTLIKRQIEDGFQYVLDANGNVMRDTLGNDIKVPKYRDVQCALIESVQTKECHIEGEVEVLSVNPAQVLKEDPLGADSFFDHISARGIGDMEALSEGDLAKTRSQPAPFPTDIDMVIQCSEALKMSIRSAMQRNTRYIF